MTALLELDGVVFRYAGADAPILDKASFRLEAGERIGLLGDNGAGKSTLLHVASGLLRPEAGRVLFDNVLRVTEKDFAAARKSLGYLLQHAEDHLFCPTLLEDVAFGPVNNGVAEKDAAHMARETLAALELEHLADRNGFTLSGGEKKLAALATILVMRPRFLFLDEPTNDLSATARARVVAVLERLRLPAVVISHDRDFLKRICTGFCLLRGGRCEALPGPDFPDGVEDGAP